MTGRVPDWWAVVLLTLASLRVWKLLAEDLILDPLRSRLLHPITADGDVGHREGLEEFLGCPWCCGFWVSIGWWGVWLVSPTWAMVLAMPWAISYGVGWASGR